MVSQTSSPLAAVLVLPVRNEAAILERSVRAVVAACHNVLPEPWEVIIAENGSTDQTLELAIALARELPNVRVLSSLEAGKGRAVCAAWQSVEAEYYLFTDIDLSVDLRDALPRFMEAFRSGDEVVVGDRTLPDSMTNRPGYRRFLSFGYACLARLLTKTKMHDLPCGLKAIRRHQLLALLPLVHDRGWFFDSELLLVAEARHCRIVEIPVRWTEYQYPERIRRLPLAKTSYQYFRALWRVRRTQLQIKTS